MAGRVERRINDKFYFVLDEVGPSSDGESELTSDIDAKTNGILNQKNNISEDNDSEDASSSKNSFDTKNKTQQLKDTTDSLDLNENTTEGNTCSFQSEDNESDKDKIKSLQKRNNCEETSAVVDMEIDSDVDNVEPSTKPLIRVTFRDEGVEEILKNSLFKFFSQKINNCTIITNSENNLEFEVYDKDPKKLYDDDLLDFDLDTTPGDRHIDVPCYGKSHDLVLSDQTEEKTQSGKLYASTTSCFNCLGNHNLRDCPEAKNYKVINQNRLKFQKQNKTPKNSRYHLDENQKFSHIVPGVFSKKLRNALNLHRDQQPGFIYRMRLLGYPPAWLEEAKVSHSGVAMYDGIGTPVLEEDEEEGEIVADGAKDKFDLTKIIDFPGFNVPLPSNFKDESNFYSCPALSEDQSKESLIKILEPKTVQAYVKKSLTAPKASEEKSSTEDNNKPQQSLKRLPSPTIEEMEEKKRQLLMELNGEDSDVKLNSEDSSGPGTSEPESVKNVSARELGGVKNLEFGTPILKSVTPFSKLPSREQFSVNVSDVINFENLPNSTGKYETMRHVITKIRFSVSKTQSEN